MRVSFADGVDTQTPVDWAGGETWNRVLAATVAQAGYRIDVGHNEVTILSKKPVSSHHEP
ncbi:hypothetical protein J2D73_10230 [Acetobacter sacchari]|uniref:Uncharacterized protein n=1 Tax=Acetobacter sacchari TaxID=2661687 RepID=A0ABS3LWA0_9PROT|nr:hypothetical protein [Acetobacter sacchari]